MSPELLWRPVDVPPGYPREYECELRLRDGRVVWIRPILPTDAPQLGEAMRTADPETLHRRFLGGPPRVTPALLAHLSIVDYQRRFALVATDPATARGVALARYEQLEEAVAEVAVVVDPAWRRVGLATALVEMLAQAGLDRGIRTFSAYYSAENRPVAALLGLGGGTGRQVIQQGFADAAVVLDRESVAAAMQDMDAGHHVGGPRRHADPFADSCDRRSGGPAGGATAGAVPVPRNEVVEV